MHLNVDMIADLLFPLPYTTFAFEHVQLFCHFGEEVDNDESSILGFRLCFRFYVLVAVADIFGIHVVVCIPSCAYPSQTVQRVLLLPLVT